MRYLLGLLLILVLAVTIRNVSEGFTVFQLDYGTGIGPWWAQGMSVWSVVPYLLLTAVFVSVGPLLYLVVRGVREKRKPVETAQAS